MVKALNLDAIRIDGGTQSRVEIDNATVAEYGEALTAGAEFPPVIVFNDGADHWLADGFHRYHGHRAAGRVSIGADVRQGTVRDAILFSLGANASHGLRRTNADKRKAVQAMFSDSEWSTWSDGRIAQQCGVSGEFVRQQRAILQPLEDRPTVRTVERGGKTYQQDVSNIGKNRKVTGNPKKVNAAKWLKAEFEAADLKTQVEAKDGQLAETQDAIATLAEENERLSDRLAVEAMDGTPEEKALAAQTIEELRATVKALTAELEAVKDSRDGFMRENAELKRQCAAQRRELERLKRAA